MLGRNRALVYLKNFPVMEQFPYSIGGIIMPVAGFLIFIVSIFRMI